MTSLPHEKLDDLPESKDDLLDLCKETRHVELILWLLLDRQLISLTEYMCIKYYRDNEDEKLSENQRKCQKIFEILNKKLKEGSSVFLANIVDVFEETGNQNLSWKLKQLPFDLVTSPASHGKSIEPN